MMNAHAHIVKGDRKVYSLAVWFAGSSATAESVDQSVSLGCVKLSI